MDTIGERAGRSMMQGTTIREVIEFERRDARNAALEEAAKVCDERAGWYSYDEDYSTPHLEEAAAAIRALKT